MIVCYCPSIVRSTSVVLLTLLLASAAFAEVLFPSPLHITREILDPISGSTTVVDEYCHGNRLVSVSGRRTAIAEYDRNLVTTIDFDAGTYTVTKFDDLAKAWAGRSAASSDPQLRATPRWTIEQKGDTTEARRAGQFVRVTADPRHRLSRNAAEVLLGVAYPNRPDPAAEVLLGALRSKQPRIATNAEVDYALPLEQVMRHEIDGEVLEMRSTVVRVGTEPPPPEVMTVPVGARLVESDVMAARRLSEELDGQ